MENAEIDNQAPSSPQDENNSSIEDITVSDTSEKQGLFSGLRRSVSKNAERVGKLAANAGGTVARQTGRAGKAVGNTAASTGKAIAQGSAIAGRQVVKTPKRIGSIIQILENSPQLKTLAKSVRGLDFLLPLLDKVDVIKAQETVASLQRKFPDDLPRQIANKIITEKAVLAATSGFASSSIPGTATLLFAGDLAANTALQAEMIYQIAIAYGFDPKSPDRKGEIITIFGLALGGNYAAKTGLKAVSRNLPIAGAMIGASSNAVLMFSLGKIACQFYESQANHPEETEEEIENLLEEVQEDNDEFLEDMVDQEIIMDEILVHMWLAASSERKLVDLLKEIKSLNVSPASMERLQNSSEIIPIDTLIHALSADYLPTVWAKCKLVAKADGIVTKEEQGILLKLEERVCE